MPSEPPSAARLVPQGLRTLLVGSPLGIRTLLFAVVGSALVAFAAIGVWIADSAVGEARERVERETSERAEATAAILDSFAEPDDASAANRDACLADVL